MLNIFIIELAYFVTYELSLSFILKIAADLLDLVGDGAFEFVQDLISVRI